MLGMLGASVTSGRLVTRWGRYKIFPIVGTALMTIGAYLLSLIDASTNGWVLAGYMFVFGVGMGLVMQVLVVAVQNSVPYSQLGTATATATFFRTIGGAFGVAVLGAVFNAQLLAKLRQNASPAVLKLLSGGTITANPAEISHLPPAQRIQVIDAFSHSLQTVFVVAVPFAIVAFALSFAIKEIPLRTTAHVTTEGTPDAMVLDAPGEFPGL
jgi:MFS family permease